MRDFEAKRSRAIRALDDLVAEALLQCETRKDDPAAPGRYELLKKAREAVEEVFPEVIYSA